MRKSFKKFREYPCSVISAFLGAVWDGGLEAAEYDFGIFLSFDGYAVTRFLIFFCMVALFTETCFQGKKKWKTVGIFFCAAFAGIGTYLIGLEAGDFLFGIPGTVLHAGAQRVIGGAVVLLPVFMVGFCYRKTRMPFYDI